MDSMINLVTQKFETVLADFGNDSATAISAYLMPIAWVALAIMMLLYAANIARGKQIAMTQDMLIKTLAVIVIFYGASGGYFEFIIEPLSTLGLGLVSAVVGGGSPQEVLSNLWVDIVKIYDLIFSAIGVAFSKADVLSGVKLIVFGVLVGITTLLLMVTAFFFFLYAKLGLQLVLAVGPFFVLMLMFNSVRGWFFSWLNTAMYFVIYQVFIALFILLFVTILQSYLTQLNIELGSVTFSFSEAVLNLVGLGDSSLEVTSTLGNLCLISLGLFFLLLQLQGIVSSITSGSGGQFGNGLYAMSMLMGRGGGGDGDSGKGSSDRPRTGKTLRLKSPT